MFCYCSDDESSHSPLLTPAGSSAANVNADDDALNAYLSELSLRPILSREQETALALRYRNEGDSAAFDALVTSHLSFVVRIAMEYRSCGPLTGDLIQEGNLALMRAVRSFDPARGRRLLSYAVFWIRAAIRSFIRKNASLCPNDAPGGAQLSPSPTLHAADAEIKGIKNFSVRSEAASSSFRDPGAAFDGRETADTASQEAVSETPEETLETDEFQSQLKSDVRRSLACLCPRDRDILTSRLMADEPVSLRTLAVRYGISRERAGQIEARARKMVRRSLIALRAARMRLETMQVNGHRRRPAVFSRRKGSEHPLVRARR